MGIYLIPMPRVYHHRDAPPNAVNIDRQTKWGNHYRIGMHGDRAEVVARHKFYFLNNLKLVKACKEELRGQDLVCWCKPEACHGDILLEVANEGE